VVHQGKVKVDNSKLFPRGTRAIFIGLGHDQGMRCWLALDPHSGRILKSNHVVFDETVFPLRNVTIPLSLRQTELDRRFIRDMLDNKNESGSHVPDHDGASLDNVPTCDDHDHTTVDPPRGPVTRSSAQSRPGPPRSILRSYAPGSGPQVGGTANANDAGPRDATQVGGDANDAGPRDATQVGVDATQVGVTPTLPTTRSRVKWSELSNEGPTFWHGTRGLNFWNRVTRLSLHKVNDIDLVAWICDVMPANTGSTAT